MRNRVSWDHFSHFWVAFNCPGGLLFINIDLRDAPDHILFFYEMKTFFYLFICESARLRLQKLHMGTFWQTASALKFAYLFFPLFLIGRGIEQLRLI